MNGKVGSTVFFRFCFLLIVTDCFIVEAKPNTCKPNGKIWGKKPLVQCNRDHDYDCCKKDELYNIYKCSPEVSNHTEATLTLNSFDEGEDGGAPFECDNK
ncbi:hypothetical protein CRYUN_Cryun14cG0032700 [Craigia yunnanensis]